MAAALGDVGALAHLLPRSSPADVQTAFGLAVINGEIEAARLALRAGADVNARLPVHAHSTALHHAAGGDRADIIAFLLEHGARTDVRDTLWDATPLGWARYGRRASAIAALERVTP
ncbi:MAG TPA: ankyrin repeat domain-containing protein [Candidatus Baltobacteraceae bacterium]|nr:ankyrin repeat domain-containing protein [Candidatus Baltobacteraceae bacterium]